MIARRLDEGARVARELMAAIRTRPFRVALALSIAVHLVLFATVRWEPVVSKARPTREFVVRIGRPAVEPPPAPVAREAARPKARVAPGPPSLAPASPSQLEEETASPPAPVVAGGVPARDDGEARQSQERSEAEVVPPAAVVPVAVMPEAAAVPLESGIAEGHAAVAVTGVSAAGASPTASQGTAAVSAAAVGMVSGLAAAGTETDGGLTARSRAAAGAAGSAGGEGVASEAGPDPAAIAALRGRIDARKVYPRLAVRNGWEGRVLVEMRLGSDGRLADLRLVQGSGYPVLDEATLVAVRRAAPFPPVAGSVTVPVEYRLIP